MTYKINHEKFRHALTDIRQGRAVFDIRLRLLSDRLLSVFLAPDNPGALD